jgi:hypothetical protein
MPRYASNVQIPNLTAAIALTGAEQLEIVQAGATARCTTQQIANLAQLTLAQNVTTTQKNALSATSGRIVFDTTLGKLCVYTGAAWQTITSV